MVLIAVAGGTGTAGRAVVKQALSLGFDVRVLSRHIPDPDSPRRIAGASYVAADARTGQGVDAGLAGVDALVETIDAKSGSELKVLPQSTSFLLTAAQRAGVRRAVLLTIVNADQSNFGYYRVQAQRAQRYLEADIDSSVVYATQFHNLVAGIFSVGAKVGLIPSFTGAQFQPVDTDDVAKALVDEAVLGSSGVGLADDDLLDSPRDHRRVIVGGPEVLPMKDLARQWKAASGRRGVLVSFPMFGAFGKFLGEGRNLVPDHAVGEGTFSDWVRAKQ